MPAALPELVCLMTLWTPSIVKVALCISLGPHCEDHVDGAAVWPKAALSFWQRVLRYGGDQTVWDEACQDLACYG